MVNNILEASGLRKSFRVGKKTVDAVNGVDLKVAKGEIFGFLGPNGAGKTTTLRMLTTLLPIGQGSVTIAGIDVRTQPHEARKRVGYVSQIGGADVDATGREDLILQGRLYGMSRSTAQKRAAELISALQLADFADRKVATYSGGQRRRLDVALGIMHKPQILFLDEPTTGLDPQNRANLWEQVKQLRDEGTTIFLTTHYLEEADALADRLAIMDHGTIVASGTPRELKESIGTDTITIQPIRSQNILTTIQKLLQKEGYALQTQIDGNSIRLSVKDGALVLPKVILLLERNNVRLESVSLAQPSLDDVFLQKTGRSLRDANANNGGIS